MSERNMNYYTSPERENNHNMSVLSMVFGIAAIGTAIMMTVIFPMLFGPLAVIFAILSKGTSLTLSPMAKRGMIAGIVGLVLNVIILITSFHAVLTNPSVRGYANQMSTSLYGVSFDDMLSEIDSTYGTNLESLDGGSTNDAS